MQQLTDWHQTRLGLVVFAAAELLLAYLLGSLALNSGSLLQWLLTVLLLWGVAQNIGSFLGSFSHGRK